MEQNSRKTIILASTSPRRQELLAGLRIEFDIIPSDANEDTPAEWSPQEVVSELAQRKAKAVLGKLAPHQTDGIIIGSDTVVVRDSDILGKPKDVQEAASMIRSLQGREHTVFTGVSCLDIMSGKVLTRWRSTKVRMKSMTETQVLAYAQSGEGLDKAGAYAIQGLGAMLITEIEGDYFNVVGLPLSLLGDMLLDMGYDVLTHSGT
ncbi:Maf family protein [Paenibacillus sp. CAA11]|uniref:Maf family protein n=1 Tax=Paenibacillus sp. CAA11 TaxID=1532905 RepID=UPI003FA38BB1